MLQHRGRRLSALEHFLDLVDAAARPVELIAQQAIRRACGVAEPAVDALPEDLRGFLSGGGGGDEIRESGVHASELAIKTAGVQHPARIEDTLEPLLQREHSGREGVEGIICRTAAQRGMAP